MIRLVLASFALLGAMGCAARMPYPHADECIDPSLESMSWHYLEGRVTDVMSARTFRMRTDKGEIVDVSLANVSEPFAAGAAGLLRKRILGTRVSVFPNPSSDLKNGITAEVHDRRGRDIANDLLRKGIVAFMREPGYTISGYSECLNRIAAREAKSAGAGIWRR